MLTDLGLLDQLSTHIGTVSTSLQTLIQSACQSLALFYLSSNT